MASAGPSLIAPCLPCVEEARTGHSSPDAEGLTLQPPAGPATHTPRVAPAGLARSSRGHEAPPPRPLGSAGAGPRHPGVRHRPLPPREALPVPSPPLLAQGKGGATALREWPRVPRPSRPSGGHARSAARPWQPAGPRHPRPFPAAAPRPSAGKAALTSRCRAG